jgi:hypothetical protein
MSNTLAIAAATATLRNLLLSHVTQLDANLADLEVTTQPLDLARKGVSNAQLNLYLYQTVLNGAWRNQAMPRQVRPRERRAAAGAESTTLIARGREARRPQLGRGEMPSRCRTNDRAISSSGEDHAVADLDRGTVQVVTVFQTNYVSAAYEVTVILIDSHTPVKAALPVLKEVRKIAVRLRRPASHRCCEALPPRSQAARLAKTSCSRASVGCADHGAIQQLPPKIPLSWWRAASGGEISVHLPDQVEDALALSRWVPGFYTVTLAAGPLSPANSEVPFALAPRITVAPVQAAPGTVQLTIACVPRIDPKQEALCCSGIGPSRPESVDTPDNTQPTTFALHSVGAPANIARLRRRRRQHPRRYAGTLPFKHSTRHRP